MTRIAKKKKADAGGGRDGEDGAERVDAAGGAQPEPQPALLACGQCRDLALHNHVLLTFWNSFDCFFMSIMLE